MARTDRSVALRWFLRAACVGGWLLAAVGVAGASNAAVSLSNAASGESVAVPRWLYLLTGGTVVGVSALLAMTVTDRRFIRSVHAWHRAVPAHETLRRSLSYVGQVLVGSLVVVAVYAGFTGPQFPTVSATVIFVFAGARAGLTMFAYLVYNPWPAINPWRALARLVPGSEGGLLGVEYPRQWGVWPATVGLLLLVWVETVTPVNREPALMAAAIVAYSVVTVSGAVALGVGTWFRYVDPIAVLFRFYGQVAPLQRTDEGFEFVLPGAALEDADVIGDRSGVAFVVALVWELTFSGYVTTVPGRATIGTIAALGVPELLVYLALFVGGFGVFLGAYWLATRYSKRIADTYLSVDTLGTRIAPSLLAIAAGYHLAHYFAFFVSLTPSLADALVSPLSPPPNPLVLGVPGWFGGLNIAFVLLGHLLAVWIAHATAFDLFPGRLQAIKSQYPFIGVMIAYTVISLWLLSLPTAQSVA